MQSHFACKVDEIGIASHNPAMIRMSWENWSRSVKFWVVVCLCSVQEISGKLPPGAGGDVFSFIHRTDDPKIARIVFMTQLYCFIMYLCVSFFAFIAINLGSFVGLLLQSVKTISKVKTLKWNPLKKQNNSDLFQFEISVPRVPLKMRNPSHLLDVTITQIRRVRQS